MLIKIKITPRKIEASSKDALMSKIADKRVLSFTSAGSGYTQLGSHNATETLRVFNAHKINKKVKQLRDEKGMYKGRTVTSPAKWVAYVYEFSTSFLKENGMRVNQNSRNFTLTKLK